MEAKTTNALWIPSLEFILGLCSDGSERGLNVEEIETLVAAFCAEELPPKYDHQGIPEELCFNCLRYSSHKLFLVDSGPSKKLQEELMINLDCVRASGYDPIEVYCHLVQHINDQRHEKRRYVDGRSFAAEVQEKHEAERMSEQQITPNSPQQSPDPPTNMSVSPKVPSVLGEVLKPPLARGNELAFAWKDVAFNIDITAFSSSGVDQIWVLFSETVDCRRCRPYTEEDFDVEWLKASIVEDQDLAGIDLSDKYLWQEDLQKSFRLVQSDMLVLLKAFLADRNLHTPHPWIHVKLLTKGVNKRTRESTAEMENAMEDGPVQKRRNPRRNTYRSPEVITDLSDDSTDDTSERENEDDEFEPPASSRARRGRKGQR